MNVQLSIRPLPDFTKPERESVVHFTKLIKCKFRHLTNLLSKDYMYSPFAFIGMQQKLSNICSTANFVVIDVDHTSTNIHQRLIELSDEGLECILGTTSDFKDLYKYRVLIPLDKPVTSESYRRLVMGIQHYGLISDLDKASEKPSQKFYSYANSLVLHNKGSPLAVDDYLLPISDSSTLTEINYSLELNDILLEFAGFTNASPGNRTRYLLAAAFKLVERGADAKLLEQAIIHLNNLFLIPKDNKSIYRRVINFVKSKKGLK